LTTIITQKIVGQFVVDQSAPPPFSQETPTPTRTALQRPEVLTGATYKLKTPLSDHALYITINDIVIDGKTRPFEIFINSKAMDHFQWVVAMTRVISAVFRAGGEVEFLVEELRSVCDPKGGYFKKGRYVNSLVSEIGDVLATHLQSIGVMCDTPLSSSQQDLIDYAKAKNFSNTQGREAKDDGFPENAVLCPKCNQRALVILDGCRTCLACGDSKCG
jgi:hypothetical protein